MKPSTAAELAGFGLIAYAAWRLDPIVGMFTAGFLLLLIGFLTEDQAVAVAIHRLTDPIGARWAKVRAERTVRRASLPLSRRQAFRMAAEELLKKAS